METYRSVLPRFRDKKMPTQYNLHRGVQRQFKNTYNVILSKETQKDEEFLVVYKPDEALSAVYKFDGKKTEYVFFLLSFNAAHLHNIINAESPQCQFCNELEYMLHLMEYDHYVNIRDQLRVIVQVGGLDVLSIPLAIVLYEVLLLTVKRHLRAE